MTYLSTLTRPDIDVSQSTVGTPSSIAANQKMPFTSITHNNLTVSSGQLVLDANYTFIITASAYIESSSTAAGYFTAQLYDVTNSVWIGCELELCIAGTALNNQVGCFARAVVCPTVQTTVEFRIKSVSGNVPSVNNPSLFDYLGLSWYSVASF
jgi:hypothetical protein